MSASSELNDLVKDVSLSNSSTTKFDPLRSRLADWFGLSLDDIYIVSASTRASNIPIRLVQGKAKDRHHRLGVAVIGTDEVPLASAHAQEAAANNYDAVVVVARASGGSFDLVTAAVRDGDILASEIQNLFPAAVLTPVHAGVVAVNPAAPPAYVTAGFVAVPIDSLTVSEVRAECNSRRLIVSDEILIQIVTSLRANKHLLISGEPGTGKTSIAEAIAAAAARAGVCAGHIVTTATSDWTSVDTVGAYRQNRSGALQFHPGLIVEAVVTDRWAVVDEFNRSDIDKAIGQLFTLLSGSTVVLPHEVDTPQGFQRIELVPEGQAKDPRRVSVEVGASWRLIATMNDTDLDLLFDVSQALKRRFALIEMPALEGSDLGALVARTPSGNATVDALLKATAESGDVVVGPAIWIDVANYLREHVGVSAEMGVVVQPAVQLATAMQLFLVPQGVSRQILTESIKQAEAAIGSTPVIPSLPPGP